MQLSVKILAMSVSLLFASLAAYAEDSSFDDIEILAVQPRNAEVKPEIVSLSPQAPMASAAKQRHDKVAEPSDRVTQEPNLQPEPLAGRNASGV
jgi:hypothetical protein